MHYYRISGMPVFAGALFLCTLLCACSTPLSVDKQFGNLNFNYPIKYQEPRSQQTIAIVSPEFVAIDSAAASSSRPSYSNNPMFALYKAQLTQMAQMTGTNERDSFSGAFAKSYKSRLKDAMKESLLEIISRKGFLMKGPYNSFDDITFIDKKSIYLASIPSISISFDEKQTKVQCYRLYCSEEGQFQITGEMTYKLVEPLTGQSIMNRRINLSDFNISKSYVRQYQVKQGSNDVVGTAMDRASKPDKLTDNTDKALVDAINEFFALAMGKLDQFISREEILSYSNDVDQLKGLKRY